VIPLFARLRRFVVALACLVPTLAGAEGDYRPFSKEQIDQLTAQVALFPDALRSQVLLAATYPADVAEAALWARADPDEMGDAAVELVDDKPRDLSVQSLVAFPPGVTRHATLRRASSAEQRSRWCARPARAGTAGRRPSPGAPGVRSRPRESGVDPASSRLVTVPRQDRGNQCR
jgi:hypothetical protein